MSLGKETHGFTEENLKKNVLFHINEIVVLSNSEENHFQNEAVLQRVVHLWSSRCSIEQVDADALQKMIQYVQVRVHQDTQGSLLLSSVIDLYRTNDVDFSVPNDEMTLQLLQQHVRHVTAGKDINDDDSSHDGGDDKGEGAKPENKRGKSFAELILQAKRYPIPISLTFVMREKALPPPIPSIGIFVQPHVGTTTLNCQVQNISPNLNYHRWNFAISCRDLPQKLTKIMNSSLQFLSGQSSSPTTASVGTGRSGNAGLFEVIQLEHTYRETFWTTTTSIENSNEPQKPFAAASFNIRRETDPYPLSNSVYQQTAYSFAVRSTLLKDKDLDSTSEPLTRKTTFKPSIIRSLSVEYPINMRTSVEIGWAGSPFLKSDLRFSHIHPIFHNFGFTIVGEGGHLLRGSEGYINEKYFLNKASQLHSPLSFEPSAPKYSLLRLRKGGTMFLGTMVDVWYKPFIDSPFKLVAYYNCSSYANSFSEFINGWKHNIGYGVKLDLGSLTLTASMVCLIFEPRTGSLSKPWFRLEIRPQD